VPSRLAAAREKSGARDPISRVSVRFCMLSSTLGEMEIRNNNGWGTGDDSILHLSLGGPAVYRRDPGAEFRRLYCLLKNSLCAPQSPSVAKASNEKRLLTAANRCATQNQTEDRVFHHSVLLLRSQFLIGKSDIISLRPQETRQAASLQLRRCF